MSTVNKPLKYLFIAEHMDGRTISQTHSDQSDNGEGSAFSDIDVNNLLAFHLQSSNNVVSVNLQTGQFRVNNFVFNLTPQYFIKTKPFKLIFWRVVERNQQVGATVQEDMSIKQTQLGHAPYVKEYIVGWETFDSKGKKLQRTITFK